MHINLTRTFLALQSAVLIIVLTPSVAMGAESSSFRLYENTDVADASPLGSNSYSLNEGGDTWVQLPITSTNFQVVTAPPVQVEEEEQSGSGAGGQGQHRNNGGGSSGGGGRSTQDSEDDIADADEDEETLDSIPTETDEEEDDKEVEEDIDEPEESVEEDVPLDANIMDGEPLAPSAPVGPSEGGSTPDGSFDGGVVAAPITEQQNYENLQCGCICPVCPIQEQVHCAAVDRVIKVPVPIFTEAPLPSMLLLIAAFGAGYLGKTFRPGYACVCTKSKKRTPKKKK